ncbi:hypothetical protein GCM10029964_045380 [Kibdelosporangium lantanae]
MPWILVGGGVVVIAVVVVLIFALGGGSGGTGSAKATAQTAVDGMNSKDVDALKKVSCDKESVGADNPFTDPSKMPPGLTFKANLGDVQETGDKATAKVTMDITYMGVNQSIPLTFSLKKNGSDWCIDDASMSKGTPGGN